MLTKYLIIGSSAAGVSAANQLAKLEPNSEILLVGAENANPYNKCFLVDWLAGQKEQKELDLSLNSAVKFLINTKVLSLDVMHRVAVLSDGQHVKYEKALLAIGVSPFIPPIKGLDQAPQVFNFHDLRDTQRIQNFIKTHHPKQAIVIGAGLTGLECADALWRMGIGVTIVENGPLLLGKLVDLQASQLLFNLIQNSAVKIYLNSRVEQILFKTLLLSSGLALQADLVILATGVRPNFLQINAGELVYAGNYVAVNSCLQTNLPHLWAAGDLVAVPEFGTGQLVPSCSWPDAVLQGNLAACNMAGLAKNLPGLLSVAKSHFFDLDFVSFGQIRPNEQGAGWSNQASQGYQRIFLDSSNMVQGAVLIGDITLFSALKRSILTRQPWGEQGAVAT